MTDPPRPSRWPRGLLPITRGAGRAIVALFILSFLLSGASYFFSIRAVRGDVASRASVTQLCEAVNATKTRQITLWTHIIAVSAPPAHETAAARQAREQAIARFLAYVRQVFAPRDCGGTR